jgi:transposase
MDVDGLRQLAKILYNENTVLQKEVRRLLGEIASLKGEGAEDLQQQLMELLASVPDPRTASPSEPSSEGRSPKEDRPPQPGHGPRKQPDLTTVNQTFELDDENRDCAVCGGTVTEMKGQFEEAEEITVVERRFVLLNQKRQKYRCRCNANVVTAPGDLKLKPGNRYSIEFAVMVAVDKYLDHLPLERQVRIMRREGLRIDSQTLWDQIHTLAGHLRPSYEALRSRALSWPILHADETSWRLMSGKKSKKWWVWELATPDTIYQTIEEERSRVAARPLLESYEGTLLTDGCGVYKSLQKEPGRRFELGHCWAHVLRKFREAEPNHRTEAGKILKLIGELYDLESQLPGWIDWEAEDKTKPLALDLRKRMRQQLSRPIVDRIWEWAMEQRALPRSDLGEAVTYLFNHWDGLTLFLRDPRVPLDNNPAERGLRGVVVGRKNHYGSRSKRGIEVAALFYSLIETAKLCGIDPKTYLRMAARSAIARPGTITLPQMAFDLR